VSARDEVLRKVAKLLRLAERGGTPGETAAAAAQAQAMLDKHGLDRAALDLSDETAGEPIMDSGKAGAPLGEIGRSRWRGVLAIRLGRMHACESYSSGGQLHLVGRPTNAEAVRYLYAWLAGEVERLTDRHGRGLGVTWRANFALGAVQTIAERLAAQRAETDAAARAEHAPVPIGGLFAEAEQAEQSVALVRVNAAIARRETEYAEVRAHAWASLNLRSVHSSARVDNGARSAGREAGKSVRLTSARRALAGRQ
jgi:hypothetical protein